VGSNVTHTVRRETWAARTCYDPTMVGQVRRTHIVLVPGFGGFDALGQLRYYAGVTPVFQDWRRERPVSLHYFDNLPTAGVRTRARRLRDYLGKLVQRQVIQDADSIVLVGHSTGGLDIRQLLLDLKTTPPPKSDAKHADASASNDVLVENGDIRKRIERMVFLSVPQYGTNLADWCQQHRSVMEGAIRALHKTVDWRVQSFVTRAVSGITRWLLPGPSDLLDHVFPDIEHEIARPPDVRDNYAAAGAREAAAELELWVSHAATDMLAIDDLAVGGTAGRLVGASAQERADERADWGTIKTRSYATIGRAPASYFEKGAALAKLLDLERAAKHQSPHSDSIYRVAYAACASGPLAAKELPATAVRWFGSSNTHTPEPWENDGIVNTASMLWPPEDASHETFLLSADHADIIGHYERMPVTPPAGARRHDAYDLLRSSSGFEEDDQFEAVWRDVLDFAIT
jgi:triacylglycerol lipase